MNQDEKDEFKEKATEEIARLADDIKHLENDTQPISPDVSLGRLTRMDAIQNKSVAEANLNAARSRLKRIESRLQKLDSPDFQKLCGFKRLTGSLVPKFQKMLLAVWNLFFRPNRPERSS